LAVTSVAATWVATTSRLVPRPRAPNGPPDVIWLSLQDRPILLRTAGLVTVTKQGPRHPYVVRPDGLEALHEFLAELWPSALMRLSAAAEADDDG